jgi:hypothetical protein
VPQTPHGTYARPNRFSLNHKSSGPGGGAISTVGLNPKTMQHMKSGSTSLSNTQIGCCNHNVPVCDCESAPGPETLGPVYQIRRNYWIAVQDVLVHDDRGRWFVVLGYTRKNIKIRELSSKPWGRPGSGYLIPDPASLVPRVYLISSLEWAGLTIWRGGRVKAPAAVRTFPDSENLKPLRAAA